MFSLPAKVAALLSGFSSDWFVAGGWAIDLFLEKETRPHADIEIAIFRRDQLALQNHFDGWILKKANDGALSIWENNEFLEPPVHEIHCFNETAEPPSFEVLLNETNGADWIYRRNKRVLRPLSKLSLATNSGIRFLCPEAVLLYKSKNPRQKDERDFQAVVDYLEADGKHWLRNALSLCYSSHPWLKCL